MALTKLQALRGTRLGAKGQLFLLMTGVHCTRASTVGDAQFHPETAEGVGLVKVQKV